MKSFFISLGVVYLFFCNLCLGASVNVIVTSDNPIKIESTLKAFESAFPLDEITVSGCKSDSKIAEQPIGREYALQGVYNRLNSITSEELISYQYIVSIENFIEKENDDWVDVAVVLVKELKVNESDEHTAITFSRSTLIPDDLIRRTLDSSNRYCKSGCTTTVGEIIAHSFPDQGINSKDWHQHSLFGGVSRLDLLEEAVYKALHQNQISQIRNNIKSYNDFPKEGVLFQDFFPALNDKETFNLIVELLVKRYQSKGITQVIGLESRGFILAGTLAYRLGVGFTPLRKPGKLPAPCFSVHYGKEYGADTLVLAKEALKPSDRVLIIDDLIATGGSARAAIELVKMAGALPVEFVSLLQVQGLHGRASLGIPSFNLID